MFKKYIDEIKEEIINSTCEIIRIPSVYSESNNPKKPFGENVNLALEYMLDLGKRLGFRTKNIDGYCGYIEFGEGTEMLGIIVHLDVVPEGDNWTYPPFSGTIDNGNIYGRGTIDDKGPAIAALYAMKAVMDNGKVNKRVRLILGLNEENDWDCINYYKQHEEDPTIGFSPDADFPCIYAEKSILNTYIKQDYSNKEHSSIYIENIDCANNAINVVPKICSVSLKINNLNIEEIVNNIQHFAKSYSYNINIQREDDNTIKLTSYGISAHGSRPDLGENAISKMILILYELFHMYNIELAIIDTFYKYINNEFDGKRLGINYSDETGDLTLNVAQFYIKDNILYIGMNLRIPVNTKIQSIKDKINNISNNKISIEYGTESQGIYINKDNKLIKTLCKIFNEYTNRHDEPIAIGGATYARAFKNCVSFGPTMPGAECLCHQIDEYISIDNLLLSCDIYANAIYELGN